MTPDGWPSGARVMTGEIPLPGPTNPALTVSPCPLFHQYGGMIPLPTFSKSTGSAVTTHRCGSGSDDQFGTILPLLSTEWSAGVPWFIVGVVA